MKLFDANQPVVSPPVWKGRDSVAKLGQTHAIVVAVPAGSAGKVKTQVVRTDPLVAPIKKGQQIGVLKISNGDQPLAGAVDCVGAGRRSRRVGPNLGCHPLMDQVRERIVLDLGGQGPSACGMVARLI